MRRLRNAITFGYCAAVLIAFRVLTSCPVGHDDNWDPRD